VPRAAADRFLADRSKAVLFDPTGAAQLRALGRWEQVATAFARAGASSDRVYAASDAASVLTVRVQAVGWRAPEIPALVAAVAATANPDGGYGLASAWDAYQDGSVNPPRTSYTATTAGHVGPVLLAGYLAGAVPVELVERAMDSILDLRMGHGGTCIPYSSSPNDRDMPCVWNVHFGAAAFLSAAGRATGWRAAQAASRARTALTWLGRLPVDASSGYWSYSSAGGGPQDLGHQLWTALSVDYLTGGRVSVTAMLARSLWRVQARRSHDYAVASSMGTIALSDCRYATDPTVLTYAGSLERGMPYAYKVLGAQAVRVGEVCFGAVSAAGRSRVQAARTPSWAGLAVSPMLG